jgi:CRP/FNR family transcriptional regulator/CRP/FNR family cyclic AMP-dependent transcriptional regulator
MAIRKESKAATFLKDVNLFEGLDNKVINQIFRIGLVQNFRKGDLVIREGQGGGSVHILVAGKAEVIKGSKGKGAKVLARLGRGSVFGEMSVFDGAPYSASVRALDHCDVHIIRGGDFKRFLAEKPKEGVVILSALLNSISNRLRKANLALSVLHR